MRTSAILLLPLLAALLQQERMDRMSPDRRDGAASLPWSVRARAVDAATCKESGWADPPAPPVDTDGAVLRGGALERDAFESGRFTKAGQSVRFVFNAWQDELCVFELCTWGYARGWSATSRLRVTDEGGDVLAESARAGGTVDRDLLAFQAPAAGRYRIEVASVEHFFRFVLMRHAGYAPRGDAPIAFGDGEVAHGWLGDGGAAVRYAVELEAGREHEVQVLNSQEAARDQVRLARASERTGAGMGMGMGMGGDARDSDEARMRAMRRGSDRPGPYPDLWIQVLKDGEPVTGRDHYHLFTPQASGTYEVRVGAKSATAGLFDLLLRREVEKVAVAGCVVDADDAPLADVTLRFLREPDMDPVGSALTGRGGRYGFTVPPGDYTLVISGGPRAPVERVRTRIEAERELNVIYVP